MRKPRDYDAELKALDNKARQLRQRRISSTRRVGHRLRCG